jgi:hypothetical protein
MEPQRWWVEAKGRNKTVEPSAVKDAVVNADSRNDIDVIVLATNSHFSNPTRDWLDNGRNCIPDRKSAYGIEVPWNECFSSIPVWWFAFSRMRCLRKDDLRQFDPAFAISAISPLRENWLISGRNTVAWTSAVRLLLR